MSLRFFIIVSLLLFFPGKSTLAGFPAEILKYNPIDMIYPRKNVFSAEIRLPEGYSFSFIPENYEYSHDIIEINYATELKDDRTLKVNARYYFKKSVYSPREYGKLKYFYNEIIKKFNDKIIIQKSEV